MGGICAVPSSLWLASFAEERSDERASNCFGILFRAVASWGDVRVLADDKPAVVELRQAVPNDAFMAICAQHDPKRDYQRQYVADIWKTVQDEKLVERVSAIIANRVKDQKLDDAKAVMEELKAAVAPIDLKSLCDAKEMVFAQQMEAAV